MNNGIIVGFDMVDMVCNNCKDLLNVVRVSDNIVYIEPCKCGYKKGFLKGEEKGYYKGYAIGHEKSEYKIGEFKEKLREKIDDLLGL